MSFVITLSGCGRLSPTLKSVAISPSSAVVGLGRTQQFTAVGYDSDNKLMSITPVWSISGSMGVIDNNGLFTSSQEGTGSVTATASGVSGSAQVEVTTKGKVAGRVRDITGEDVGNLKLSIVENSSFNARTDSKGKYTISNIPEGTYTLTAEANATHLGSSQSITIKRAETTSANFTLTPRFAVSETLGTDFTGNIKVGGTITNAGTTTATQVRVSYLFYNLEGFLASSGSWTVGSIASGASTSFTTNPYPSITAADYSYYKRYVTCGSY